MSAHAHSTHGHPPTSPPWFPNPQAKEGDKASLLRPSGEANKALCLPVTFKTEPSPARQARFPHLSPYCDPESSDRGSPDKEGHDRSQPTRDSGHGGWNWVPSELRPTHLQVKELAIPPVDGLGRGVGPGHIDDVYLSGKGKNKRVGD